MYGAGKRAMPAPPALGRKAMIKKILSILLVVLVLGLVPVLSGCEDEIKTETHKEIHDKPVGQPTEVVE